MVVLLPWIRFPIYISFVNILFTALVFHFISSRGLLLIIFNFMPFKYLYKEGDGML